MFVVRLSDETPIGFWVAKHNGSRMVDGPFEPTGPGGTMVPGGSQYVLVPGKEAPTGPEILRAAPVKMLQNGGMEFYTDKVMVRADQKRPARWIRNLFDAHTDVAFLGPMFKAGGADVTAKSWMLKLAPQLDPETEAPKVALRDGVDYAQADSTAYLPHPSRLLPEYHQ